MELIFAILLAILLVVVGLPLLGFLLAVFMVVIEDRAEWLCGLFLIVVLIVSFTMIFVEM